MKRIAAAMLIVLMIFTSSCVPGRGVYEEKKAGFWTGIWHGAVSPISMVIGVFDKKTRIYEADNTGRKYDVGFIIGIFLIWSGSTSGCYYKRRK